MKSYTLGLSRMQQVKYIRHWQAFEIPIYYKCSISDPLDVGGAGLFSFALLQAAAIHFNKN